MKKPILVAAISALVAASTCRAVDLGGDAAREVANWTTNNLAYAQGSTGGFAINWENVLTNTAAPSAADNHFGLVFETATNYTIGHLFLLDETIDLATLPAGGIQRLRWSADFDASDKANWIPVIAVSDAGATTVYRSNNTGNSWSGNGALTFAAGTADNTSWVGLGGDPVTGIDATRIAGIHPDLQAATGVVQFGFIQWDASTAGTVSPALTFTTAIEQFDIAINEIQQVAEARSSSAFATRYNGNDIFDGTSFINDWDLPALGGTDLLATLDASQRILTATNRDNNGWFQQDNDASPWETGVSAGGSFTIEVRAKLANDAGNGFAIWTATGTQRGTLRINADSTQILDRNVIGSHDNTDDFHTFRMAYDAGFNLYFFWRDGVSLTPDAGVPPEVTVTSNRLIIGDCCSSYLMTSIDIDYVRYDTTGAFAPAPDNALEITTVTYDADTNTVSLSWRSTPGAFYAIDESPDMSDWSIEVDDSILADGDSMTVSFPGPEFSPPQAGPHPAQRFYRVRVTG